jgi:hypothetical protein
MDRSMKRGGTVLGAVLVMVLALAGVAHADHAGEMKARESFAAGRYDEALEIFAKLYAETLNPIYLRNIGRCQQKLKQPDKAIDAFHDYLAKGGKKISSDEKAEINGYIKEMEALRDEQAGKQPVPPPVAPTPAAPVEPIQQPAQPEGPPPGYTTQPAGAYPGTQGAYPPAAEQPPNGALVAQPPPQQPESSGPVYTKWWFWTIIGAVVVGGVVAAVALSGGTSRPPCTAVVCE